MISLVIDGKKIKAAPGTTVRQAALKANITIPALCHLEDYPHYTSCMLCVVKDKSKDQLIPSCTALVRQDMDIDTACPEVQDARRTALELLLSEHVGDCEAPCRRACPADMDIPSMLRHIQAKDFTAALNTVLEHIPLPILQSRVCPAPCEKICRRKDHDQPVAIRDLIRFLTEQGTIKNLIPRRAAPTARTIAVCGAGPAGLSASFYLLKKGHAVSIFERNARTHNPIRSQGDTEHSFTRIMERETARIKSMGADFRFNVELGKDINLATLSKDFDAVIMAVGGQPPEFWQKLKLEYNDKGAAASPGTFTTSKQKVFVCGAAAYPAKLAANAINRGRQCALAVDGFLSTGKIRSSQRRFDSHIGKLAPEEIREYLRLSSSASRMGRSRDKNLKFTQAQGAEQAGRCLHCDCRKASYCALRDYSTQYSVKASRYKSAERKPVRILSSHPRVVYEPGKCIKCGRCVRITRTKKEALGLTFIGRGFKIEVGVPFNHSLRKALTDTAAECVRSCPTGALAFYKQGDAL